MSPVSLCMLSGSSLKGTSSWLLGQGPDQRDTVFPPYLPHPGSIPSNEPDPSNAFPEQPQQCPHPAHEHPAICDLSPRVLLLHLKVKGIQGRISILSALPGKRQEATPDGSACSGQASLHMGSCSPFCHLCQAKVWTPTGPHSQGGGSFSPGPHIQEGGSR